MIEEAGTLAERAIALDLFDARGLTVAGHVRAFLHRRLREAIALHERALSLNPNLAMAWALSAVAYAYLGEPQEAERRNNHYKKLSPLDPHAFFYDTFYIYIHLPNRDFGLAVAAGSYCRRRIRRSRPVISCILRRSAMPGGRRRPRSCGNGCSRWSRISPWSDLRCVDPCSNARWIVISLRKACCGRAYRSGIPWLLP